MRPRPALFSIVLETPIPKRSFGDETSLYDVMNRSSGRQQRSHNIGLPVTHTRTYMSWIGETVSAPSGRRPPEEKQSSASVFNHNKYDHDAVYRNTYAYTCEYVYIYIYIYMVLLYI